LVASKSWPLFWGRPKKRERWWKISRVFFIPLRGKALRPVLKPLIRDLWATDDLTTRFIGFPLSAVPEEAFYYLQRLRNTLAEKRRQEGKSTGAGFAEIAFYPYHPSPAPAAIKTMPNNFIAFAAVRTELYAGKVVIFSPLRIILDRGAKIVYDHPCLEEALEGILGRINANNPDNPSRAFLLMGVLSD
jgi:hypothetical protein